MARSDFWTSKMATGGHLKKKVTNRAETNTKKTEFEYSPPKILFESEYSHYIYVYIW